MKRRFYYSTFHLLLFGIAFLSLSSTSVGTMIIKVDNIKVASGQIMIGIFDSAKNFPDESASIRGIVAPVTQKGSIEIEIPDMAFGRYSLAVFHDTDGSGKMKKNLIGVPTEPYGFSNNPSVKWSAPTFKETAIDFQTTSKPFLIYVKYWKEH